MNIWHLCWIVPLTAIVGWFAACLFTGSACDACQEAHEFNLEVSKAREFQAGFAEGLTQLEKIG